MKFFHPDSPPIGLRWRSNTVFIITTVAIGLFTDLFLYGLIVPVMPFMLRDRLKIPQPQIQSYVSDMLAVYAGASVIFSIPAGWFADRTNTRQVPFLTGLAAIFAATTMLALGQSVTVLIIARVFQGISAAVVWTVGLAIALDTVGPKKLGTVIGTIFSFISIGELLAPVIGGILYKKTGYIGVFGIGAGLLILDFVMRLLVIEKKVAARYDKTLGSCAANPHHGEEDDEDPDDESALLPKTQLEDFQIPDVQNRVIRALPILYCLGNPRLLVALLLGFVQASLLGAFDATIPTEAEDLFNFSSLNAGLLFIALDVPYLVLGPIAGWAVDKFGTKLAAVVGFAYLVPTLILLRLSSDHIIQDRKQNIILYCALLALNGVGLAIIGSPSVVEASNIVQNYDKANPDFFGKNGPYAQLYSFNSLVFSAGLTIGPLLSGALRDVIGYGNMNAVLAAMSGITAGLSFVFIGGKPKILQRKRT